MRHRGTFDPFNTEPYEVSRSQIEKFTQCPACFWMNRVKGIKFPGMPGWLLNTATDTLLKKDFNLHRQSNTSHPFMQKNGVGHLVPFEHDDFELWTKSLQLGFRVKHEKSNLIIGGGLDDVWYNPDNKELHIVDYKSTASRMNNDQTQLEEITLDGHYKAGFKRQMDIYQWIMRQKGFKVSDVGYFVYVNGDQHFPKGMLLGKDDQAVMNFAIQLIKYEGNDNWVEERIMKLKECLESDICPGHAAEGFGPKGDKPCEYSVLFDGMKQHSLWG
ncbi:MAG: PD-(D/E)XK nuclease family protein [Pseudomonadota bacterium]|nr:PD-(D/E)XK nuclease family protein [Pseudomonadota bacterium]